MENIKIYVESGQVFILSGSSAITGLNTSLSTAPQPVKFPANGELTASVVNTNNIKVVTSTGQIILNNVPFGNLKEKNGTTAIGASAAAVRDNLNSTHIFGSSTLETKLGVETAKITALENATKTSSGDRGIFVDDNKGTTQSHLAVTTSTANLQAGPTTKIACTDIPTGQGSVTIAVRAGANTQQTSVTAITVAGSSSFNNALVTFNEPVTFSHTVTGIDLADLDNVILGSPSDGDVLTWDNTNSYWKPVAPDTLGLTALLTDVFSAQGLNLSAVDAGADKFVMWDDSESKLTYFTPGSAFTIQGTAINVRNISNSNMTISSGTRSLNLSNNGATFRIMTGQAAPFSVENDGGNSGIIRFNGDVRFDSGSLSGGILKLEENPQGGSNFVALQAPSSLSGDLTLKLPATDGSNGQFLQTDGSGNLSFASASGSGGGGPILLGQYGGRFQWSSTDEGERVALNTFYGFSYFAHSTELSQVAMNSYDASQTVDSTTTTVDNKKLGLISFPVLTTDKKVKCCYSFYLQSHNTGSTWGMSLWSGTLDTSGNLDSERTVTLRAETADITATTNSNTRLYHGEFTTTSNINGGRIIPMIENRTGNWSGTVYAYGVFQLYYVD